MACIIGILRIYTFPLVIIHNAVNWRFYKSLLVLEMNREGKVSQILYLGSFYVMKC